MTDVKPPSIQETAQLITVAVVEVQADGQAGFLDSGLHQFAQVDRIGIFASAFGNLKDQRRLCSS